MPKVLPSRVAIPGSERVPLPAAQKAGPVDAAEQLTVSAYLRPGQPITPELVAGQGGESLSRDEFAAKFGANTEDLAKVKAFAQEYGLSVRESDPARRLVVLGGPVSAMSLAFEVDLARYEHPDGSYRGREGAITIPAELDGIIESVHGLDDRPQARPHLRSSAVVEPRQDGGPYSPVEVAKAYNFPTTSNGSGECVAIIELGGGYIDSDLQAFFDNNGIPKPTIVSVGVDGATNSPGGQADGEVALDIEIVGAVAPGARIAVYFAPNSDQGFIDAITTAAHDTTNAPSVISISWGQAESAWSGQSMQQMDQAFQAALLMGVTVFAASGDNGSGDAVPGGLAHVDFPASSPHAVGCGGTTLSEAGGAISSEVVWNSGGGASGGGVSDVFDVPSYQSGAGIPPSANPGGRVGRGVPDIAGNADPTTGYQIVLGGQTQAFGGTSAVAPLWAGLVAKINGGLGHSAGFIHPILYGNPTALHDITSGANGAYTAGAGWDPCTGLGSPDGTLVGNAIGSRAPAAAFGPNEDWTHGPYYGSRGTFFADVTGDGKADAIVVNDDTVTVRRSDGTQFLPNEDWTHGPCYGSRGTFFADVDGDGRADLILVNDDTVTVRRSDGTQFLPNEDWTHAPYFGSRGTFFADVTGDGKADAIVVNNDTVTVRRSDA